MDCWKFIELMNEYAHTYADHYDDTGGEIEIKFLEHTDNCFIYHCDWKFDSLVDDTVISNRFGFIKRLVKNDKIDRHSENLELDMKRIRIPQNYYISWGQSLDLQHKKAKYLDLIALLSIQDEPIKYLCEIIK